MFLKHGVLI